MPNARSAKAVYNELKASVVEDVEKSTSADCTDDTLETYLPASSLAESSKKLTYLFDKIKRTELKRTEYHCMIGIELANMKYLNIINKCANCIDTDNIYTVLDCRTCTNSKRNNSEVYFDDVKKLTGYSKDYVNYFIVIGRLSKSYPKFKYNTLPIDKIKLNLKYLREQMSKDVDYWQ